MTENSKENMINKISYNNQKQLLYNLLSKSQIDNSKAISLFVDILKLEPQNRRNSEIQIEECIKLTPCFHLSDGKAFLVIDYSISSMKTPGHLLRSM